MPNDITIISDPLQPPLCLGCGYDLTGLPAACTCPECGLTRGIDVLNLRGWAISTHSRFSTSRPAILSYLYAFIIAMPLLFAITIWLGGSSAYSKVATLLLALLFGGFFGWHRHECLKRGYGVIAVISVAGVGQFEKMPAGNLKPLKGLQIRQLRRCGKWWRLILVTPPGKLTGDQSRRERVALEFQATQATIARLRTILEREGIDLTGWDDLESFIEERSSKITRSQGDIGQ
jgi:hypothetical protein